MLGVMVPMYFRLFIPYLLLRYVPSTGVCAFYDTVYREWFMKILFYLKSEKLSFVVKSEKV
jgi:hypothetical protein